jgi:hypothetical protein
MCQPAKPLPRQAKQVVLGEFSVSFAEKKVAGCQAKYTFAECSKNKNYFSFSKKAKPIFSITYSLSIRCTLSGSATKKAKLSEIDEPFFKVL